MEETALSFLRDLSVSGYAKIDKDLINSEMLPELIGEKSGLSQTKKLKNKMLNCQMTL